MWFKPGDKVVCIFDDWPFERWPLHSLMPVKGHVYTIRDMYEDDTVWERYGVHLEESIGANVFIKVNPTVVFEVGFCANKFRPVVENKGMQTLFTILKQPKPAKVDA